MEKALENWVLTPTPARLLQGERNKLFKQGAHLETTVDMQNFR